MLLNPGIKVLQAECVSIVKSAMYIALHDLKNVPSG